MTPPDDIKNSPKRKHPALGRGLAALLGDDLARSAAPPVVEGSAAAQAPATQAGDRVIELPVERLEPNPYQPRRQFDDEALAVLADSIREHGVLQPLVVRPTASGYQLIAGERRFRASQLAGLAVVPVVVRQATDQQALLLALLENLQREDLNPMEEAKAFNRLLDEFSLTQEEVAQGVGKDRSTVANSLRLLKLPAIIQDDVCCCRLSAGHARTLLPLETETRMRAARERILAQGLSVRATERLVKAMLGPEPVHREPTQERVHLDSLAHDLGGRLGAKVEIKRRGKKGSINIRFSSDQELERLLEFLS